MSPICYGFRSRTMLTCHSGHDKMRQKVRTTGLLAGVLLFAMVTGCAPVQVRQTTLQEDPSSIRGLSPHHPLIRALADIAVDRQVPFHSIIGDRRLGDAPQGSDGVVPYTSAPLKGAAAELIVPADHSAQAHPLAVLEVKRILKLHLQQHATTHQ